mgnify:CR=1 FL=1
MLQKIIIINVFCLLYCASDNSSIKWHDNNTYNIANTSSNILNVSLIEQSAHDTDSFWLGIHCYNTTDIAGFQFELPAGLKLLDVKGGRAKTSGFDIHKNNKGLILGFSMIGDAIRKLENNSDSNTIILKVKIKVLDYDLNNFAIKTILADPNGEKISFQNSNSEILITINNNSQKLINISFYE